MARYHHFHRPAREDSRPSGENGRGVRPSLPSGQGQGAGLPCRVGLIAILLCFCALATAQSFATRLQWGPDEPGHIIYVRSLALDGRFPALSHGEEENAYLPGTARTHESHQPPLYYVLAALAWRAFRHLPEQTVTFRDPAGGQQGFLVPGAVRPVRLLSVLLGAAALALTWATARTVFPGRPALCLGALALAAWTPMFTYMSGVINNDALLTVAVAALAWQWARMVRFGAGWRQVIALGLLLGVAMNVKETAVGLVAVSLIVLAAVPGQVMRVCRPGEVTAAGQGQVADLPYRVGWRERLAWMAAMAAITAALSAWWFVRKWLLYGSPLVYPYIYPLLGLPEAQRTSLLQALPRLILLFTFVPADVISAHANVELIGRLLLGLVVLSVGGLALACLRRKAMGMPQYEAVSLALWVATALVVLLGLVRNVLTVDWRMGTSGGRYLVCVVPLLALTAARGLSALFGERRWARVGLAAICVLLLALNIQVIWATAAEYGTVG